MSTEEILLNFVKQYCEDIKEGLTRESFVSEGVYLELKEAIDGLQKPLKEMSVL